MATVLLKKEANIPPLQLYIEVTAMQKMQKNITLILQSTSKHA